MPSASYVQNSFLGGEWSPYAQGRFDKPEYKTALNVCLNSMPLEEGAITRRPGERFLGFTRSGAPGALVSFDFEAATPYNMEFTDGHLRFFGSMTNGPLALVTTNDDLPVVTLTADINGNVVVNTSSPVQWATGDQAFFNFSAGISSAFAAILRRRIFTIVVITPNSFSISDAVSKQPVSLASVGWSDIGGVSISRALDIPTPYKGNDLNYVRSVQSDEGALLLNGNHAPQSLTVTPATENIFASFNLTPAVFRDGPYLNAPAAGTLTPSGLSGTITLSGAPAGTFASTDVGRMMRLFSEPAQWDAGAAYASGAVTTYQGAYYTALQATTGNIPGTDAVNWGIATNAAVWVWGTIIGVTGDTAVTFAIDDSGLMASALLYLEPIDAALGNWRLGLYSDTTSWPTCGTYAGGRIWLSGAVVNRLDSSTSSDPFIFSPTGVDGTVSDNNGISYTLNATDANPIFWMHSAAQGIICGTQGGEWLIKASTLNDPITPTSIDANRVTKYGCANILPRETGLTLTFVQRWKRKLFEYFPDVFSGRYTAPNLSLSAAHLTQPGIEDIAFQKERVPTIWSRTTTGDLLGTTYKRDSLFSTQGPTFLGWHRHELGSGRSVESVSVGTSQFGNLDSLSMITNDPATGIRHVSVLTDVFGEDDVLSSSWFLDDAVIPSGGVVDIVANTLTLNGLWHLNGKSVSVFASGLDCGDATVVNGSVTVPFGDGIENLFCLAYMQTSPGVEALNTPIDIPASGSATVYNSRFFAPVVVGQTFKSQGQLLRVVAQQEAGAANGPALGKTRRTHQISVLVANAITGSVKFGTDFINMNKADFKTKGGKYVPVNQLYSGIYQNTLDDEYGFDSMICWEIDRPLPLTVTAVGGFLQTQDR